MRELELCLTGSADTHPANDQPVGAVRTDSRAVVPGDVFFCLEGERHDGHDFARQALDNGALAVVARKVLKETGGYRVIAVDDTLAALGRLAACWRDKCGAKVVAVTGSAGKTTVKEMLASILSQGRRVAKNHKNFNNQVGLPISMLATSGKESAWIMEVGISRPGDMEELGPVAAPDMAVIHNIGLAHTEGLGSLEGVAEAKTTLLKYVRPGGEAVVSRDYPLLWERARSILPQATGFSVQDEDCDYFCAFRGQSREGGYWFTLKYPGFREEITLPYCGSHFAENVAACAAAAHLLGASPDEIIIGLTNVDIPEGRFCSIEHGDWLFIDDTYNANPLSMERAVDTAATVAGVLPLVLVLGDMRELGNEAEEAHMELGRTIAAAQPVHVFYRGEMADAVLSGMAESRAAIPFDAVRTPDYFLRKWREANLSPGVALFKGSRSLGMEEFLEALRRGREA